MNIETKSHKYSTIEKARARLSSPGSLNGEAIPQSFAKKNDSDALVSELFSAVISPTLRSPSPTIGDDAEALREAAKLLVEATEDGTLTEREANAVLNFVIKSFTVRRFDKIFSNISKLDEADWFLAASKITEHEQRRRKQRTKE